VFQWRSRIRQQPRPTRRVLWPTRRPFCCGPLFLQSLARIVAAVHPRDDLVPVLRTAAKAQSKTLVTKQNKKARNVSKYNNGQSLFLLPLQRPSVVASTPNPQPQTPPRPPLAHCAQTVFLCTTLVRHFCRLLCHDYTPTALCIFPLQCTKDNSYVFHYFQASFLCKHFK
jgi:hypothetical protein